MAKLKQDQHCIYNNSYFSFLGLSQSLPVTSYIKMIDIWMLFTMTIPFLEVVLHTTHEVFKNKTKVLHIKYGDEEQEEEAATTNNIMKLKLSKVIGSLTLPICSLVFTVTFWAIGLIHAYTSGDVQDSNMADCLTIDLA